MQASYNVHNLNDSIIPTKGFVFNSQVSFLQNTRDNSRSVGRYAGSLRLFVPLAKKLSIAVTTGAAAVTGSPEFYQYVSIGGSEHLRGFRRDRFWGKTSFYNLNELRYVSKVKSYLYSGKVGLLAFFDNGRVWMPQETFKSWHVSYGPGLIIAPLNKVAATVTYGFTREGNFLHLRVNKWF